MNVNETDDGLAHVMLDGRFDIAGAQQVDPLIIGLAESSKGLIVDLSKVSFIASLGVRTLMLSAKTLMRRGSELVVCGANENIEKVLRGTGFNEVAGLYPDYESAYRTLKERLAAFPGGRS